MISRLGLLAVPLLLCASPLSFAQQTTGSSTRAPNAEITIRGCVNGQNRYTLMQASTGAVFALSGDTARLSSVRGKLIEVTGNEYAPSSGELPGLTVKTYHVLANDCPIQPRAQAARPPAAGTQGRAPAKSTGTAPYADPGTATQTPPNVNNPNIQGDTGAPGPGTGNSAQTPQ
jgi:hypothetical protein